MSIGALSNFKKSWRGQTALQVATLSVLAGSFTIISMAALVHQNMQSILTHWGNEVKVNVYLKEDAQDTDTKNISDFLNKSGEFSNVEFLTKKKAVEKFKSRVGQYVPGLLNDLEFDNPLPASFEMSINGGMSSGFSYDKLLKIVKTVKSLNGVDEVSYGQGWVENYAAVLKVFSVTSISFIIILLAGALFVVGNSIRNAISQRRDEIEILELCGATRAMIIWPYLFEGFVTGVLAASLALISTYGFYSWQIHMASTNLTFWNFTSRVTFLSESRIIAIILMGASLGVFGSYLWVRKISTGWAAAESSMKS
jgi:cell division transport system permease protein